MQKCGQVHNWIGQQIPRDPIVRRSPRVVTPFPERYAIRDVPPAARIVFERNRVRDSWAVANCSQSFVYVLGILAVPGIEFLTRFSAWCIV